MLVAASSSEPWETLYAASQEINCDDELRQAANGSFRDTGGGGVIGSRFSSCVQTVKHKF